MATYHVGCDNDNVIYAGTQTKTGSWNNKSDVTTETLEAVRNHFLNLAAKEQTNEVGYRWEYDNGATVFLKIVIEQKEPKENE